jgi:hypothetical protein
MFHHHPTREIIRWTARALSLFSTFLLLLFIFGEPFPLAKIKPVEWLGLTLFPVGVVAGFVVAWWREGWGGSITIASLLAFYVIFLFLMNERLSDGGWFLVFAIPGFLFLISSYMTRLGKRDNRMKHGTYSSR